MKVLQVLVSKLTLILEVPRARLVLMHVEEARSDGLRTGDVRGPSRLQMLSILRCQDGGHRGLAPRANIVAATTLGGIIVPRVVRRLLLLLLLLGEEVTRAKRAIHADLVRAGVLMLLDLWAVLVMGMVQLLSSWWTVIAVPMQEGAIVLLMVMMMVTG